MNSKKIILLFLLIIVISQFACETHNSTGEQRGGVFLTIDEVSLNTGAGALATIDEDTGTITAESDTVAITLTNRPKNENLTSSPWLGITTDEYQVTFYRIDGGTKVPNSLRRKFTYTIEFSESLKITNLTILSAEQKVESPLWDLAVNGYDTETGLPVIEMNIMIEIFGKITSGEKVYAKAWTSIAYGVTVQ
jgi:hypothetical protein